MQPEKRWTVLSKFLFFLLEARCHVKTFEKPPLTGNQGSSQLVVSQCPVLPITLFTSLGYLLSPHGSLS